MKAPGRLFIALMFVLGAPAVFGADCLQDFPDARATVVMCGLDNARGLAFAPDGALHVAEAGRGGLGLLPSRCFTGQVGGTRCYGATGAITRLSNGVQERVVEGLPSHASVQGVQAIGPTDIAFVGVPYVTIGLQQPPDFRKKYEFLADFARLIQVLPTGAWRSIADLGAYEAENDPDCNPPFCMDGKLDTNPYGLLATQTGRGFLVTDAGGNSLVHVAAKGDVSTYAVFEPHLEGTRRRDAVPTSVALGPDGAYYVGELTAFPPTPGAANVYRIAAAGAPPEVCLSGFTLVIDIEFDQSGNLYVLEYGPQGKLHRIAPQSPTELSDICAQYAAGEHDTLVGGLAFPTALAVGPDGEIYFSHRGIFAGTGQVIRLDP